MSSEIYLLVYFFSETVLQRVKVYFKYSRILRAPIDFKGNSTEKELNNKTANLLGCDNLTYKDQTIFTCGS